MNLVTTIRLALTRIRATKTRSLLTMLGVVIGVGSLVALTSVASGATSGISNRLSGLGARQVTVSGSASTALTDRDVAALQNLSGVAAVSGAVSGSGTASYHGKEASVRLAGVSADYQRTAQPELMAGSFLPASPELQSTRATVISLTTAQSLGLTGNPIGKTISLNGTEFMLVGVLNDTSGFRNQGTAYVTLSVARTMFAQVPFLNSITVLADAEDNVDTVSTASNALLASLRGLRSSDTANFSVSTSTSLLSTIASVQQTLKLLLGGIASISLLVGGIGIMNIMLVSVRERTREIGVRRAVGAKQRQIMAQFMIEAIVLSLIGGLVGLAVGELASYLIARANSWAFTVSGGTVGLALGFSAVVGIVFGVVPARTAAKLQPVDALRFE